MKTNTLKPRQTPPSLRPLAGLIVLPMMISLLTACAPQSENHPIEVKQTVPKYTSAQLEAIIHDEKSCGPAAKAALYDWSVMDGL